MPGSPSSRLDVKAAIAGGRIVLVNPAEGIAGAGSACLVVGLVTHAPDTAARTQMALPYERPRPLAYLDGRSR